MICCILLPLRRKDTKANQSFEWVSQIYSITTLRGSNPSLFTDEDFDADDFGYGHIAIFDGTEDKQDYEKIGLTGGLEEITPETVEEQLIGGIKWSRLVVVYNDSYSMILWLPSSIIKNNKAVDTLPSVSIAI